MQSRLSAAVFALSLGIGIVIGCSAPSPDGTNLSRGRGSSGNAGDATGDDEEDLDRSNGSPTCENHAKVDDRPACDECARANCCEQVLECDKTADCQALMQCLDDCAGDFTCVLTCQIAHERGAGVLSEVAACAQMKCKAECPEQDLDAGIDFDAF